MADTNLRIGVVGIPGKWSSEALVDAVRARTGNGHLIDISKVDVSLVDSTYRHENLDLRGLDGVIVKKISETYSPTVLDRLEILRSLALTGVPVISSPDAIIRLISRLSCTVALRSTNIPMPETVITECLDVAARAIEKFGTVVLKPLFSTKARGMVVLRYAEPGWKESLEDFAQNNPVIYIQKFLTNPGRDLGVVFLGGKYLATYARVGHKDSWNTTIHSGGHYEPHEPSARILEIAQTAQRASGLDFTCVDVVETDNGPLVFEVSAFGGFRGLRDAHGIDAADLYVSHAINTFLQNHKGAA